MVIPPCDRCSARNNGPFSSLAARQLTLLMQSRVPHAYLPGQHLFFQGNPALAVYCVHQGSVKLSRLIVGGDTHVIATRGAGDLIGHRAVLTCRNYRVSAEPLEHTTACAVSREVFLELVRDNAEFAFSLLLRLARDSIQTEDLMLTRALHRVRTRLARFLLRSLPSAARDANGCPLVPLRPSHEEIAHVIDTTPETLSRTLRSLAKRGILEPGRHDVRLLDVPALERLARYEPGSEERSEKP